MIIERDTGNFEVVIVDVVANANGIERGGPMLHTVLLSISFYCCSFFGDDGTVPLINVCEL
jgi:hypothetical protein